MDIRERIRDESDEYKAQYARVKARVRREVMAQVNEKVDQEMRESRVELSKLLHEAHVSGVPIAELRVLTGAYTNAQAWNPLWKAYDPGVKTDLRTRKRSNTDTDTDEQVAAVTPDPFDETTVTVTVGDKRLTMTGVTVVDGELQSFDGPDEISDADYRAAWSAMEGYLAEHGTFEIGSSAS